MENTEIICPAKCKYNRDKGYFARLYLTPKIVDYKIKFVLEEQECMTCQGTGIINPKHKQHEGWKAFFRFVPSLSSFKFDIWDCRTF